MSKQNYQKYLPNTPEPPKLEGRTVGPRNCSIHTTQPNPSPLFLPIWEVLCDRVVIVACCETARDGVFVTIFKACECEISVIVQQLWLAVAYTTLWASCCLYTTLYHTICS
jgi:hypothetical protein